MPTLQRHDPYSGHIFHVTVNGVSSDGKAVSGSFAEISGLGVNSALIEYGEGSDNNSVHKMTGLSKFTSITCKRGITEDIEFWDWVLAEMFRGSTSPPDYGPNIALGCRPPWDFSELP